MLVLFEGARIGGLLSVVDLAELVIHAVKAFRHGFFHPVQLVTQIIILAVRAVRVDRLVFHSSQVSLPPVNHQRRPASSFRDHEINVRQCARDKPCLIACVNIYSVKHS